MSEFLFIGGSCDGRRLRCEDGRSVVRVVKPRPLGAPLMRHTEDLGRETEDYRRCSFTSGGDTLFVYVAPSVADKDIMAALIAGYSRGPGAAELRAMLERVLSVAIALSEDGGFIPAEQETADAARALIARTGKEQQP